MSDIVKYLPDAAIPAGGARRWKADEAERWFDARVPALFAPFAGALVLAPLVVSAVVLLAWNDPGTTGRGTDWIGYPAAVLLIALPFWYRFLPVATLVSAPLIAGETVALLTGPAPGGTAARAGGVVVLTLSAWAFTGALLRVRARRRQRSLFLAEAAGTRRRPVPGRLADAHVKRGRSLIVAGAVFCLAGAAALLAWGLALDLRAEPGVPYDAIGQQIIALLLLVPGTTLLGRGLALRRAARQLHRGPQPVVRIGVRRDAAYFNWLHTDARTTGARPLIAYRTSFEDTLRYHGPTLVGGSEEQLRVRHHDIDPQREPFEALLYGVPCEGAEVLVEFAVFAPDGRSITTEITAAPLLARRRSGLKPWTPAGSSYRVRRREEAEAAAARRAAQRASSGGGDSGGGCGGGDSSCGSSCGGGCGGD
ncbi:hypothetical protein [Streptomyces xanthophaeus]|uniref:hypothetical protein n=1 Tax=Streptomyces xanthophaeus TaxID=67385 RepID=UPI00364BA28E